MKVALIGVTGYAGETLYQMLCSHPDVDEIQLYGHDLDKPEPLAEAVPSLGYSQQQQMIQPYSPEKVMAQSDCVFFATSAGVTSKLAAPFIAAHFPTIDLSGDMRLKDPKVYEKWYHKPAAPEDELKQAYYGLPEFASAKGHTYIANPGCYATATLLGLIPLVQNQLLDPESIIVDAKSGTSGAGKKLSNSSHFSIADENLQLYKVNCHQHVPEILQELQSFDSSVLHLQFTTTLLPLVRGLMSTIYVKCSKAQAAKVPEAFEQAYENQPWVVYSDQQMPTLKSVVGSNFCAIGTAYNEDMQCLTVVSVIDNLIKGAGGEAIQNFNQMFDLDAKAGLPQFSVLP